MTTIQSFIRLPWLRATLAALGVAVTLASVGPTDASAQRRTRAVAVAPDAPPGEGQVNIQTASAEQLQLLPGVGPAKAQAIVTFRERRAFRRVEDIMLVRGIGRATFRRLRPMISVEGPTTLAARVRATRPAPVATDQEEVDERE